MDPLILIIVGGVVLVGAFFAMRALRKTDDTASHSHSDILDTPEVEEPKPQPAVKKADPVEEMTPVRSNRKQKVEEEEDVAAMISRYDSNEVSDEEVMAAFNQEAAKLDIPLAAVEEEAEVKIESVSDEDKTDSAIRMLMTELEDGVEELGGDNLSNSLANQAKRKTQVNTDAFSVENVKSQEGETLDGGETTFDDLIGGSRKAG